MFWLQNITLEITVSWCLWLRREITTITKFVSGELIHRLYSVCTFIYIYIYIYTYIYIYICVCVCVYVCVCVCVRACVFRDLLLETIQGIRTFSRSVNHGVATLTLISWLITIGNGELFRLFHIYYIYIYSVCRGQVSDRKERSNIHIIDSIAIILLCVCCRKHSLLLHWFQI